MPDAHVIALKPAQPGERNAREAIYGSNLTTLHGLKASMLVGFHDASDQTGSLPPEQKL